MAKSKKTVKIDNAPFWTKARLSWMRDVALPKSMTIAEALRAAENKWQRPLSKRRFETKFVTAFGNTPGKFLGGRRVLVPSAQLEVPPLENPIYLQKEIKRLEKELKIAQKESAVASMVKSMLHGAVIDETPPPKWLLENGKRVKAFHGVPTLLLSDIHHGETVYTSQVNGANEFNVQVSRKRVKRIFCKTIHLLEDVFANADYPGIVLALGGDMVSGNIHEEIRESNEIPIFDAVLDLANMIISGIELLKERFVRVFVPCVVGNHGRIDRKPRMKNGPQDNYEYILYHYIAAHYKDDDNVTVLVSDSFTCHYRIYGCRYLLTHGDQFRGGSGISGPILPWTLGEHRLRKQMQTMSSWTKKPSEYDILLFGHWHTYFPSRTFVANGSIKGFDEYAKKQGFAFEPPQQALWLTNPEYGMTFNAPVFAVEASAVREEDKHWVALPADDKKL